MALSFLKVISIRILKLLNTVNHGLFTNWKFGFHFDLRLHVLQSLLFEFVHFDCISIWCIDATAL